MEKGKFIYELLKIQDNLYKYAFSFTLDTELAKDLLHDTLLKVLINRDKYTEEINLKGWTYIIMKHIFINDYRKNVQNKTQIEYVENLYLLDFNQNLCYGTSDSRYIIEEIDQIIDSFSEIYTKPFYLYISGFKYTEIAKKLNVPEGTVKSRIFYMRQKLQIMLKDYR